jgi:pyruvate kinase
VLSSRAVVGAMRRTKIVATLGPATDDEAIFKKMITAGVDVVRLNYSHQTREKHSERVAKLRELTEQLGVAVGVIADLRGPKIRI